MGMGVVSGSSRCLRARFRDAVRRRGRVPSSLVYRFNCVSASGPRPQVRSSSHDLLKTVDPVCGGAWRDQTSDRY